MDSGIGFLSLPEDLLLCIFDSLRQEEKLNLSSACKKLRQLYLIGREKQLLFHLRAIKSRDYLEANEEFSAGLKQLLQTSISYKNLRVSAFHLFNVFEKHFSSVDTLFDKSLSWYHENSLACKNVQTLVLDYCPMTEVSIANFFRLFPNLKKLAFINSGSINASCGNPIHPEEKFKPLKVLWIPILFYYPAFLEWILQNFTDKNTKIRFSSIRKERCMHRVTKEQLSIPDTRFQETMFLLERHDVTICQDDIIDRINPIAERLRYQELLNLKAKAEDGNGREGEVSDDDERFDHEVDYRYDVITDRFQVELTKIFEPEFDDTGE